MIELLFNKFFLTFFEKSQNFLFFKERFVFFKKTSFLTN
ncbi:hypothetical protein AXA84_0242 [Candidatus Phytoplasma oryzae]|uniref:Uncharacterized protein n=1 Tax=Candidatus Phytoplasma oryzae TaxID=203274 RepID=A0A139JQH0_9MOLU|nr:hypothetical protein AXA84_0401 [Candidatus Phytoplasma oryzae]KXT29213.1 hypothetical protein AXA84_0242 [Candidatus Phytoplasma oryzae]